MSSNGSTQTCLAHDGGNTVRVTAAAPRRRRDGLGTEGAAALEFALILPVLITILFGIVQFGFLFSVQNTMTHAAREAARTMSVEQISAAEGEAIAQDRLGPFAGMPFTITATEPDPSDPNDLDVVVAISIPVSDAVFLDLLGIAEGKTMSTQSVMRRE